MRLLFVIFVMLCLGCNSNAQREEQHKEFPLQKSESEWRTSLTSEEFQVLRKKGTEPAFSSELNNIEEAGTFVCAACGHPLYKTAHKFDSGTGWPSFDRAAYSENVIYRPDRIGGFSATEVLCANCGSHLGHIFNDGPKETTGKRHCINGVALNFIPEVKK